MNRDGRRVSPHFSPIRSPQAPRHENALQWTLAQLVSGATQEAVFRDPEGLDCGRMLQRAAEAAGLYYKAYGKKKDRVHCLSRDELPEYR